MSGRRRVLFRLGEVAGAAMSGEVFRGVVSGLRRRRPAVVANAVMDEVLGPLKQQRCLDGLPADLAPSDGLHFEHLAGLFASTPLDCGIIGMTIRQAAYLFGLIRQMAPEQVIEIGRYKGGSTFLMAVAMRGAGRLWSIDHGEKEARLGRAAEGRGARPFDVQLADRLRQIHSRVTLVVGDSRTVTLDTEGPVDLVLIDGDHRYEGVKSDMDRFGRRVRVGGAVLLDDAFDDGMFPAWPHTVGRLAHELVEEGGFRLVRAVNSMAHLERVR